MESILQVGQPALLAKSSISGVSATKGVTVSGVMDTMVKLLCKLEAAEQTRGELVSEERFNGCRRLIVMISRVAKSIDSLLYAIGVLVRVNPHRATNNFMVYGFHGFVTKRQFRNVMLLS